MAKTTLPARLRRLFFEGFTAMDVAEPLASFDTEADAKKVRQFLLEKDFDLIALRQDGRVCGYARRADLVSGRCGDHLLPFSSTCDLVPESASLLEVVRSLAINRQCFVTVLDQPTAIVTLEDLEKPPMRMFLFGLITIGEMLMTDILRTKHADGSWQALLSEARLDKAKALQVERTRRGQSADLIDCLQYGDKGWILSYDEPLRKALGYSSRRQCRDAIKEMEQLRNNLAHTQAIIPDGWQRIIIACNRIEQNLEHFQTMTEMDEAKPRSVPLWQRLEKLMRSRETGWWERLVDAIPELAPLADTQQPVKYHAEGDVAEHTRLAIAACPAAADPDLLWVALLHDIGKPATTVRHGDGSITAHDHARVGAALAEDVLRRLGLPQPLQERIVWAVRHHTFHHSWQLSSAEALTRKQQAFIADERFLLLLEFLHIDADASLGHPQRLAAYDFYRQVYDDIMLAAKKDGAPAD